MEGFVRYIVEFWCDEDGATGAEYALLLAIVATGMVLAATALGTAVTGAFGNTASCINAGFACGASGSGGAGGSGGSGG